MINSFWNNIPFLHSTLYYNQQINLDFAPRNVVRVQETDTNGVLHEHINNKVLIHVGVGIVDV